MPRTAHYLVELYAKLTYFNAENRRGNGAAPFRGREARAHASALDVAAKRKLARAAAYQNASVSDFVLMHAVAAAERVIEAHEKGRLSAADWDVFYEALVNPPEPNEKLREAARRCRERVGE
jgi:uncharacterized protein (DUF1778 family)